MGGRPAPDLLAANKDLVTQIQAIESLQITRDTHNDFVARKESLKQNLMRAISQGLDPTTMPEELAKSRAVKTELEQTQARIRELLPRVNIFDIAQEPELDCPYSPTYASRPKQTPTSLPRDQF